MASETLSGNMPGVKYSGDPYGDSHKMATHVLRTTEELDGRVHTTAVEVYNEGLPNFHLKYTPGTNKQQPLSGSVSVPSGSIKLLDLIALVNFLVSTVNEG